MALVLQQILDRSELTKLPKPIQTKLEKFLGEQQQEIDSMKFRYEKFKVDSEQQSFEVEKRLAFAQQKLVTETQECQHLCQELDKLGGTIQQYTYSQGPSKPCTSIRNSQFPVYLARNQQIQINSAVQPYSRPQTGKLHREISISLHWKGLLSIIHSAVSVQKPQKPEGYDYFVISKDTYYSVEPTIQTAFLISSSRQPSVSKDWYHCH